MAKSKIIKDLANGTIDTTTALKRAKVLFSELNNDTLSDWVNNEISGYPTDCNLPDYRNISGNLIGSYFKGSMANHMTWTNVSIPLGNMPKDTIETLLNVSFHEGVDALKHLIQQTETAEGNVGKSIPADLFPIFNECNNDPFMMITSARVVVSSHHILNIFSSIESRLLDALMLLEKKFGCLDDLDIDISSKTPEEVDRIANDIIIVIYNDQSVTIGNGNKIKDATIASVMEDANKE